MPESDNLNNTNKKNLGPLLIFILIIAIIPVIALALKQANLDIRKPVMSPTGTLALPTLAPGVFSKPLGGSALVFPSVQSKLRAGDFISVLAVRKSPDTPMTANSLKFQSAVSALEGANLPGLNKVIQISSVEDVKNLISALPTDINIIGYDMEQGMTPQGELSDIPGSVSQFASVVHAAGKQVGFGPTIPILTSLQNSGNLNTVVQSLDFFNYQGQKVYANGGAATFEQNVNTLSKEIRNANPRISFGVQLWLGQETAQEIIQEFKAIENLVDHAGIGSINDASGTETVLIGLGR